ncbi:MAG: ribosome biogenesis GTPase Der [Chitinivibrionales bacterium]|nr:ribosome biogenesis GTPase Der [Chitinivibrionales bacterium]
MRFVVTVYAVFLNPTNFIKRFFSNEVFSNEVFLHQYPIVSIIGRPNVGKSSLFNRILNRRVAVVDDMAGVTRDRHYQQTSWNGYDFILVDTGGLVPQARATMSESINNQVITALEESAAIIFLLDGQSGSTDLDLAIAALLRRKYRHRVVVAVNKSESTTVAQQSSEFLSLGCGTPIPISALHGTGVGDILDEVVAVMQNSQEPVTIAEPPQDDTVLSIAIVGRPNAGKSSLVNKLLRTERMIVDSTPGTTRDAIDSALEHEGVKVRLIDTAGLRRKSQVDEDVEYYSNLRALQSVQRCTVCCLLIDTAATLAEQDLKIVTQVLKFHKGLFVCWNKWDLVEKDHRTFDQLVKEMRNTYMELQHVPMISISALSGMRVTRVIETALTIRKNMTEKVKPSELRDFFFQMVKMQPHPYKSSKEVRFLGIKQLPADYPLFKVICTNPSHVVPSYRRFLVNQFHEEYGFAGCPIVFHFSSSKNSGDNPQSTEDTNG